MRIILALNLALVITGCGSKGGDYQLDANSFGAASLAMVQKCTGIQLPAGSRGLNMFYQGSQIDPSFVAKVEIPESSREALTKSIEQIRQQEGNLIGSLTAKVTWWKPSDATILVDRQFTDPTGAYVRAILCQEGKRWILYLEWYSI